MLLRERAPKITSGPVTHPSLDYTSTEQTTISDHLNAAFSTPSCICPTAPNPKEAAVVFCDAEVTQIVYNVLQRARDDLGFFPASRSKRFSATTFNDLEWFFIGRTSRFCTTNISELPDFRDAVNLLSQQIPQYGKLFQCDPSTPPCSCGKACGTILGSDLLS
uniref:CX domain-containing protein n=1 Tax=Steinernema glaseri TaxID=37863 RepID=A0A1I7Y1R4_9BILA